MKNHDRNLVETCSHTIEGRLLCSQNLFLFSLQIFKKGAKIVSFILFDFLFKKKWKDLGAANFQAYIRRKYKHAQTQLFI